MIRIVAATLEEAYKDAAASLECSVTELNIEVVQPPSSGFLGLFKKSAIIVAVKKPKDSNSAEVNSDSFVESKKDTKVSRFEESSTEPKSSTESRSNSKIKSKSEKQTQRKKPKQNSKKSEHNLLSSLCDLTLSLSGPDRFFVAPFALVFTLVFTVEKDHVENERWALGIKSLLLTNGGA